MKEFAFKDMMQIDSNARIVFLSETDPFPVPSSVKAECILCEMGTPVGSPRHHELPIKMPDGKRAIWRMGNATYQKMTELIDRLRKEQAG
jgi:hypothetical protein